MSLPYEDLFSGTLSGIYVNVVRIKYTIGDVSGVVCLNDSGSEFTFNNQTYIPVAFSLTEPDKASTEEGSGTLAIVGVPSSYVEMVQQADIDEGLIVDAGLVKLVLNNGVLSVEGNDYILAPTEYRVESLTMNSSTASLSLNLKSGGVLGYVASTLRYTNSIFPGLCG